LLQHANPVAVAVGQLVPAQRVLVLAPHADDEILGCGGALLRYVQSGTAVSIIYLTDGRFGIPRGVSNPRRKEARAVGRGLGGCEQTFWNVVDGTLGQHHVASVRKLQRAFAGFVPDVVFIPWFLDRHPDHAATALAAADVASGMPEPPRLLAAYESVTPIPANHAVDISDVLTAKARLLALYESQERRYAMGDMSLALNRFRGLLLRRGHVRAAEGFYVATAETMGALASELFKGRDLRPGAA
jgi:LmbE family N-acetylglucosaminyl deacetylase